MAVVISATVSTSCLMPHDESNEVSCRCYSPQTTTTVFMHEWRDTVSIFDASSVVSIGTCMRMSSPDASRLESGRTTSGGRERRSFSDCRRRAWTEREAGAMIRAAHD